MSRKKLLSFEEFAAVAGSREMAAQALGVDVSTYGRWINGTSRPRGRAVLNLLDQMGVRR